VTQTVECWISDEELRRTASESVPISIAVRLKLGAAGFEFMDDGKISAAFNQKPEFRYPTEWQDVPERGARRYRQKKPVSESQTVLSSENTEF